MPVLLSSCSGLLLYQGGVLSISIRGEWSDAVNYGAEWGVLLMYFWCSTYLWGDIGCGYEVVVCLLLFFSSGFRSVFNVLCFSSMGFFCSISYVSLSPNMFSICCSYVSVSIITAVLPLSDGRMVGW